MAPPQVTATSEASLRSLSNFQLAAAWVHAMTIGECTEPILREFRLREWERHEEMAMAGDHLELPPPWRILRDPPTQPLR